MNPIHQNSLTAEEVFKKKLEKLSHPILFKRHLIVNEQSGLERTNFLQVLWQKLRGMFGFSNRTNPRLIEFKTLEFLYEGRKWVHEEKEKTLVQSLAKQVGLTPDNEQGHLALQSLVKAISHASFNQDRSESPLEMQKFYKHCQKEFALFKESTPLSETCKIFFEQIGEKDTLADLSREELLVTPPKETASTSQNQPEDEAQKQQGFETPGPMAAHLLVAEKVAKPSLPDIPEKSDSSPLDLSSVLPLQDPLSIEPHVVEDSTVQATTKKEVKPRQKTPFQEFINNLNPQLTSTMDVEGFKQHQAGHNIDELVEVDPATKKAIFPKIKEASFIKVNVPGDFKTRVIGLALSHHFLQNNWEKSHVANVFETLKQTVQDQEKLETLNCLIQQIEESFDKLLEINFNHRDYDQEMIRFIKLSSEFYWLVEYEALDETVPAKQERTKQIQVKHLEDKHLKDKHLEDKHLEDKHLTEDRAGSLADAHAIKTLFNMPLIWVAETSPPISLSDSKENISYCLLIHDQEAYLAIPPYTTEVGIPNCGNACYRSASNQAIFNTPYFKNLLEKELQEKEGEEDFARRKEMHTSLSALMKAVQSNANPKEIKKAEEALRDTLFTSGVHAEFSLNMNPNNQYDAGTYLEAILMVLHYIHSEQISKSSNIELHDSKPEPSTTVQMTSIPGEANFQELVNAKFSNQIQEGHWRSYTPYVEEVKITSIPPQDVLVFHLKNREVDNQAQNLTFPEEGIIDFSKAYRVDKEEKKYRFKENTVKYRATSFIFHEGDRTSGHYTAYVKKENQWYLYDDDAVELVSEEVAKEKMARGYIFFFEKTEDHSQESECLIQENPQERLIGAGKLLEKN